MRSVTVAVCCLGIVAGCRPAADPEGQLRDVRAARDQLYKAFSAYDSAALFGSYAEGGGWVGAWGLRPLEDGWALAKRLRDSGVSIEATFQDEDIGLEGPVGWMTYRVREILTSESTTDTADWIESAVFVRQRGTWKMTLLHSSRVSLGQ